jgi:hypothetical protein
MTIKKIIISILIFGLTTSTSAQFGKLKGLLGKKDSTQTEQPKEVKQKSEGGGFGSGLMNKIISKVAKVGATLGGSMMGMVGSTNDLTSVVPSSVLMVNLHPTAVQEIGQNFFNGWEPSGSAVILNFTAKNKQQFTKIEGTITIDGKPADFVAVGCYSAFFKDNTAAKKVEITSNSGQKAAFTINPPKQKVKLLAVNGQKENISLDLTKDVILEFEPMNDNSAPISVWLTGTTIGIKTLYEVGWYAPKSKITIPAAAFRNMNGVQNNIGFGGCYLQVSRLSMDKATNISGAFPEIEYAGVVSDGKFLSVLEKPVFNKGIEVKFQENGLSYEVKKVNALFAPAFNQMKTLGVMGFSAQGVTSYYDKKENKLMGLEVTKSASFPQFDDAVWDAILEKTYTDIMTIIENEFAVKILPLETVTNSVAYKNINSYSTAEQNTTENFSQAYKNSKLLLGKRPLSELSGIKSPEYKVMKEVGANALLNFTLHLDLNFENSKAIMIPSITYSIGGEILGENYNSNYVTGTVTGKTFPIKNKQVVSVDMLENTVLNRVALVDAFKKSIQAIKAKEKTNGDYEAVWNALKN